MCASHQRMLLPVPRDEQLEGTLIHLERLFGATRAEQHRGQTVVVVGQGRVIGLEVLEAQSQRLLALCDRLVVRPRRLEHVALVVREGGHEPLLPPEALERRSRESNPTLRARDLVLLGEDRHQQRLRPRTQPVVADPLRPLDRVQQVRLRDVFVSHPVLDRGDGPQTLRRQGLVAELVCIGDQGGAQLDCRGVAPDVLGRARIRQPRVHLGWRFDPILGPPQAPCEHGLVGTGGQRSQPSTRRDRFGDHLLVGLLERCRQRIELLQVPIEAEHAGVEHCLGLLAPLPRRPTRLDPLRLPLGRVVVQRGAGFGPRLGRKWQPRRVERPGDRLGPLGVPDLFDSLCRADAARLVVGKRDHEGTDRGPAQSRQRHPARERPATHALELGDERLHVRPALRRVVAKAPEHRPTQPRRRGHRLGRGFESTVEHGAEQRRDGLLGERSHAVQRLVERYAKAELVGPRVALAPEGLRGHVRRRPDHRPRARQLVGRKVVGHGRLVDRLFARAGQPEVHDAGVPVLDQHVVELEIAVHQSGFVRRGEAPPRLDEQLDDRPPASRLVDPLAQRWPLDEIHRNEAAAVGPSNLVYRDDIGVAQLGQRARLSFEPRPPFGIARRSLEQLERNPAIQLGVPCRVDDPHRPRPELAFDDEPADLDLVPLAEHLVVQRGVNPVALDVLAWRRDLAETVAVAHVVAADQRRGLFGHGADDGSRASLLPSARGDQRPRASRSLAKRRQEGR